MSWVNDDILDALRMAESGGSHYDEKGNLTKSSAGALGAYQWMPKSAKDPGYGVESFDINDEAAQRKATRQYLEGIQRHNPSWTREQVLQAYNWGPGNVDKFLSGKRQDVPKEAREYAGKVLSFLPKTESVSPEIAGSIPRVATESFTSMVNSVPELVESISIDSEVPAYNFSKKKVIDYDSTSTVDLVEALFSGMTSMSSLPLALAQFISNLFIKYEGKDQKTMKKLIKKDVENNFPKYPSYFGVPAYHQGTETVPDTNHMPISPEQRLAIIGGGSQQAMPNPYTSKPAPNWMQTYQPHVMQPQPAVMEPGLGQQAPEGMPAMGGKGGPNKSDMLDRRPTIAERDKFSYAFNRGTDTVPAMLTPGEAVIPREAAQHPAFKPIIKEMINTGRQMQDVQYYSDGEEEVKDRPDPLRNWKRIMKFLGGGWNDDWGNKNKNNNVPLPDQEEVEYINPVQKFGPEPLNREERFDTPISEFGPEALSNQPTVEPRDDKKFINPIQKFGPEKLNAVQKKVEEEGSTFEDITNWIENNLGFTKQDAYRALAYYIGGRISGGSHKGSLQWAGQTIVKENQARQSTGQGANQQLTYLKSVAEKRLAENLYTSEGARKIRNALASMDANAIYAALNNPENINKAAEMMDLSDPQSMRLKDGIDQEILYRGYDNNWYKLTEEGYEQVSRIDYENFSGDIRDNMFGKINRIFEGYNKSGRTGDDNTITSGSKLDKLTKMFGIKDEGDFRSQIMAYAKERNLDEVVLSNRVNDLLNIIPEGSNLTGSSLAAALSMIEVEQGRDADLGKLSNLRQPIVDQAIVDAGGKGQLGELLRLVDEKLWNTFDPEDKKKENPLKYTASTIPPETLNKDIAEADISDAVRARIQAMPNPYWKYVYLYAAKNNLLEGMK